MGRYDSTERLGIIETDRVVTKDLGWIFREQPIMDVGIDAIIEQVVDGDPTGKLMALQIKTGLGNFHVSHNKLTYYATDIHRNYWLEVNIPVILVAVDPELGKVYWKEITENSFRKTPTKWALEIPLKQELCVKSERKLSSLLLEIEDVPDINIWNDSNAVDEDVLYQLVEDVKALSESVSCMDNIKDLILTMQQNTEAQNENLRIFREKGFTLETPEVKSSMNAFGKVLRRHSARINSETEIFSETFSIGFAALEKMTIAHFHLTNDTDHLTSIRENIKGFPIAANYFLETFIEMNLKIEKLPDQFRGLKEGKNVLSREVKRLIDEISAARDMVSSLNQFIEDNI